MQARPDLADLLGEQERREGIPAGKAAARKAASLSMGSTALGRNLLSGGLLEEEMSEDELLVRLAKLHSFTVCKSVSVGWGLPLVYLLLAAIDYSRTSCPC